MRGIQGFGESLRILGIATIGHPDRRKSESLPLCYKQLFYEIRRREP